jgi:Polypeptide deformylase
LSSTAFRSYSESLIQKRQYQPGSNPPLSSRGSDDSHPRNLYSHRPGIGIHMPRNTQHPARALVSDEICSREIHQLIEHMRETMRDAPGVGLAAPQIGRSIQLPWFFG